VRARAWFALLAWLKSHGWKYFSLIYCERKILFVGWKSTAYKTSEQGVSITLCADAVPGRGSQPSSVPSRVSWLLRAFGLGISESRKQGNKQRRISTKINVYAHTIVTEEACNNRFDDCGLRDSYRL
jgi:hypothetical protein